MLPLILPLLARLSPYEIEIIWAYFKVDKEAPAFKINGQYFQTVINGHAHLPYFKKYSRIERDLEDIMDENTRVLEKKGNNQENN